MSARRTRIRVYVAFALTIALGFLLPPSVNLNHFRPGLSESLSRSVGRPVSIQDVHLRLLPLPGFTFRQLRIADDDEFGAEPILQTSEDSGQHSVATLHLASLWRGRLEIASISLTQASLNLARAADGHWNLEHLIDRAAQIPSAPTTRKRGEARPRFPYIELKESRINFKFGPEKKPFALSESEFALWLAAENRWNVRLKAVPLRTDESITDTGVIKLSGSFDRSGQFSETPFHFQVSWERPEVNAIARITRGHDPGWRGTVDLDADFKGTPVDFVAKLNANVDEFRRYDIARSSPLDVNVSCDSHFRADAPQMTISNALEFKCKMPLDSGSLTADGAVHPLGKSPDFSVRLFASEVPASTLIRAMLRAKSTLPDDLTADGEVNGNWVIERKSGEPTRWKGTLTAANATLRSMVLREPLVFPPAVDVRFESDQQSAPSKASSPAKRRVTIAATGPQASIAPFTLDLGGDTQVSATLDSESYRINLTGHVEWQRFIQVSRAIGLHPPATDVRGSGILTAQYSGEWHHFGPPTVSGQMQIRSAVLSLRGFSEPLHVSAGTVKFDGQTVRAEQIEGSFPHSSLAFAGTFEGTRQCEKHAFCDVSFSLRMDELHESALLQLLSIPSGISLPFFNSGHQFEAKWLLEVAASGTLTAQHFAIQKLQAKNVTAQLQLENRKLLVRHWTADVFGGKHEGEWAFDFSGQKPSMVGTGSIQHARAEDLESALDRHLGTGNFDLQYRLSMSGVNANELASTASGTGIFVWKNGTIQAVHPDDMQSPSLSFGNWSGKFRVERRHLALEDTKMSSPTGVREVSGEVSFDRQWTLKFLRTDGSSFTATGSIANPMISSEAPPKVAEAR